MNIDVTIYGEPIPQARPRFANGHAYESARSRNYKTLARFWMTQKLKQETAWKPLESALTVDITFYMSIPSSWSKKRKEEALNGVIRPTTRNGDIDNLIKAILDAGNGLLWVDDTFITDITAHKRYGGRPRTEITVKEVTKC